MTCAAVVLAAGGGSRFGGDTHKLLAPFRGRPLVAWALEAACAAGLGEVAVVTGPLELSSLVEGRAALLENPQWADGLATSLQVGLEWCSRRGHDAVVVGLGDQPLVPAASWTAVARCEKSPISVATYGGSRRNPVRLHRSVWPLLPRGGDEGARALFSAHPQLVTEVSCDGDPCDIDTLEDLARWS